MLIIFDCDGTLVDSQANIIAAMEDSFLSNNLPPPDRHAIRQVVGLSLVETMQKLLPHAGADLHVHMAEDYKQAFHRLRARGDLAHEPLYPGIADLIPLLHAQGYDLGIATGKSDRGLAMCLEHHKLKEYFITLQTADRHPSKPHPSMIQKCLADSRKSAEDCWMIGDTAYDVHMANNAQVRSIGVDWGYHSVEDLKAAGATYLASEAAAIAALVQA
jgi:phosphoglycolate phosphatase